MSAYNILLVLILLLVLAYFAIFNLVDGTGQWQPALFSTSRPGLQSRCFRTFQWTLILKLLEDLPRPISAPQTTDHLHIWGCTAQRQLLASCSADHDSKTGTPKNVLMHLSSLVFTKYQSFPLDGIQIFRTSSPKKLCRDRSEAGQHYGLALTIASRLTRVQPLV